VIHSILSFRETTRFDLKSCELDKDLGETVKLARIQYKDYGDVQLEFNVSPGDYEIVTDPALVSTAVMNLLTNARKYNPQNKPVELSLSAEGHQIIIEVKDQGVGIPGNEYDIVFKKFERGIFPKENKIDGLGIGLAASKNNIELLGGNITFQSQVGKGSTFTITLSKTKFHKSHMIVTEQQVKNPPDLNHIKDISLREKIKEKLDYDTHKKMLTLRGTLTDEQHRALIKCYKKDKGKDKNIAIFNRKAIDTLHRKSQETLNMMQIEKK
jgi:anti-sigma regulatory factor (Ser/Thr protein kinase)